MVGVNVSVHGVGVGCDHLGACWECANGVKEIKQVVAVADVGRYKRLKLLEPVVKPSAEMVHEGASTANNGLHLPRCLWTFRLMRNGANCSGCCSMAHWS